MQYNHLIFKHTVILPPVEEHLKYLYEENNKKLKTNKSQNREDSEL